MKTLQNNPPVRKTMDRDDKGGEEKMWSWKIAMQMENWREIAKNDDRMLCWRNNETQSEYT